MFAPAESLPSPATLTPSCSLNVTLRTAASLLGDYKVFYHQRIGGRPNLEIGFAYVAVQPFVHPQDII